jgi:hypothetical protein
MLVASGCEWSNRREWIGDDMQASGSSKRTAMADGSWMAWSVSGLTGIWTAVVLISVLAPDLVSGSAPSRRGLHHVLWGLVATGGFLWAMARQRGSASRPAAHLGRSGGGHAYGLAGSNDPEPRAPGR